MNFSSVCNILKYQDKLGVGAVFAIELIFPFAPPVASDAPSKNSSSSGTPATTPAPFASVANR